MLERAVALGPPARRADPIDAIHIPLSTNEAPPTLAAAIAKSKDSFEAQYYASASCALAGGNVTMAAKLAKRTRAQLYEALRRLDSSRRTSARSTAPRATAPETCAGGRAAVSFCGVFIEFFYELRSAA